IENNTINSVIIGIGVNISTIEFPDYVENAACLGRDIKRADLIAEITAQLEEIISLNFGDYIDYYRSHSMIIGKDITFIQNGVSTNAKALEIDSSGGLKVRLDSGESITLRSGEISIRV
ncbi:MAG: biotin--[Eubacterium sp.]|nr:biotin--[acetyl-CoA-carboxylase] ligase [Eubacterium sp.]